MDLTKLEFHDYANVFPLISEEQIDELANDIKKNGLIEPITLLEGKILDGRNRYNACKQSGRKLYPEDVILFEEEYAENDPILFVISKNIKRRHLTVGQRAAAASELLARMTKAEGQSAKARGKKVAKEAGVALSSVEQAQHIQKHAPELHQQLKAGKKSLHKVAKEAAAKLAGADLDTGLERIETICGKSFRSAIEEDQIDHINTPKSIAAFAKLPDAHMKAVAPVLQLGWTLNRAIAFIDKEVTPATTGQQMLDLFVFKGSKRMEFELDGVKFVLTRLADTHQKVPA